MPMSPEILASIISSGGTVFAALIAALAAALIGKRFLRQEKLKTDLDLAIQDIRYLLNVEQRHCELHKEQRGESNRQRVRDYVSKESDIVWSGRFTPGRVKSNRLDV